MEDGPLLGPFLANANFNTFHSCMYGGKRRKSTAFLMNFSASNLMEECDNSHNHLPWGLVQTELSSELKFSTSLED